MKWQESLVNCVQYFEKHKYKKQIKKNIRKIKYFKKNHTNYFEDYDIN